MSHRWDCPTRWEAEREGERAYERGSWSNPYERKPFEDDHCREAERSWEDGRRYAERRHEEQQAEERASRQAAQRRQWAQEEEEASYWRQQEEEHNRQMEEEYNAAMEALQYEQYFWMEQDQLLNDADGS